MADADQSPVDAATSGTQPEGGGATPPPIPPVPPQSPQGAASSAGDPAVETQQWERQHAMITHIGIASSMIGLPVVLSLVLWLMKRNESHFIDDHGKEAVNFQLSLLIYGFGGGLLALLAIPFTCGMSLLALKLGAVAMIIVAIISAIKGAQAANGGLVFRYPVSIRLIH